MPGSGCAEPLAFIHELGFADLPVAVVAQVQRCLIDLIGVAAGGVGTPLSAKARRHVVQNFGPAGRGSRMLFDGRSASRPGAALAGGMTIDSLDAHDGHVLAKGHVGAAVLPALLALTDAQDSADPSGPAAAGPDGRGVLTSMVVGYEIGTRAGIALHATAGDYHSSGAWNSLACAAVGARLMGLARTATEHALGIAEYHAPRGPMMRCIDHPTMVKDNSGWGAMSGVSAALLAADGFTGAPAILVHGEQAGIADVWADLGTRWRITEQYLKPYPVCRWAQPAVQAVLKLLAQQRFSANQIDRVEVVTFDPATRLTTRRPATTEEAQYSLPFPVAAALVRGRVGPAEVGAAGLTDGEVLRCSDRVVITESGRYSAAFPERRWAEASVVLLDGRRFESGPTTAIGDPEDPMTDETLLAKFHDLADGPLGRERSDAIVSAVGRLTDQTSDPRELYDAILRRA